MRSRLTRAATKTRLVLVVGALLSSLVIPATASANGLLTTLSIHTSDNCVNGVGPADTELELVLRGSAGGFQGRIRTTTDGAGFWDGCFLDGVDQGETIYATDQITSRTYVVPRLETRVNRKSDVIAGIAPPNSTVFIEVMSCGYQLDGCSGSVDRTRPTSATGAFKTDLTSEYDVRGEDFVTVYWESPSGDRVTTEMVVPFMHVGVGRSFVEGAARRGTSVRVDLRKQNGSLRSRATTNVGERGFGVSFRTASGAAIEIKPGNIVEANIAPDARMKIPSINPHFDLANDIVTGTCFPNQSFRVHAEDDDSNTAANVYGTTNGSGDFTVDLALEAWDLEPGNLVEIHCRSVKGDLMSVLYDVT